MITYPQIVFASFEYNDFDTDDANQFYDMIHASQKLYQLPLKYPNVCFFLETTSK